MNLDLAGQDQAHLPAASAATGERNGQLNAAGRPPGTPDANRAKRIAFIIHAMTPGGAERATAIMANHWAERGRKVTVITIAAKSPTGYQLDDRVAAPGLRIIIGGILTTSAETPRSGSRGCANCWTSSPI